ncbi:Thioredoxin domain-containing protein [Heracleum sosnowskyi]|uniref:Thioredoxin domain-containing protein n=1 Tax=Heracleum sosnowskyi TaxID=360622 RepID=A0AAD8M7W0_9APIA|nr:Thioredoxin domain-containing protein [Heracleum sosnowskyi]
MAGAEGQVISCHSLDQWNEQLQKGIDSKKLVVVDFTASWCGPCRFIAPVFAEFAKKIPNVLFLKVDVDELAAVAKDWSVEAMPTFIFLKEGKLVDKIVGAKKEDIHQTIIKHATVTSSSASA